MRRSFPAAAAWLVAAVLSSPFALSASAADRFAPQEVALGGGVFDPLASRGRSGQVDLEIRFTRFDLKLGRLALEIEPALGGMTSADGALYGYLAFRLPVELSPRWDAALYTGAGVYSAGSEGKDLGGPVEFRSGAELTWRLTERSRVGLSFYHLSNGVLYDLNPGSESLVALYSVRLGG